MRICCIVLLVGFFFPCGTSGSPVSGKVAAGNSPVVRKVVITIQGGEADRKRKLEEMAAKMIPFKTGDRFSEAELVTAVDLLRRSGRFEKIEVPDRQWDADTVDLLFRLTPVTLIEEIKVTGAFPVFTETVINRTGYRPGGSFRPTDLQEKAQTVATLFREKGYIDPQVEIVPRKTGDCRVSLTIAVDKGVFYRTGAVEIRGNRAFCDIFLKMRMKSYALPFFWGEARRFVKADLEADIETLTRYYRENGFVEADITYDLEKSRDEKTVTIVITVWEGPRYKVRFLGNRAFSAHTLRRDVVFFEQGDAGNTGIEKSLNNIEKRYVRAGYKDAAAGFDIHTEKHNGRVTKTVVISIEENRQYLVKSCRIKGAHALEQEILESQILTGRQKPFREPVFVREIVHNDCKALEKLYRSKGYQGTRVRSDIAWREPAGEKTGFADVVFLVEEGAQIIVDSVDFKGNTAVSEAELYGQVAVRRGEPLVKSRVRADQEAILAFLREKGYLYAAVTADIISLENRDRCRVRFVVNENRLVETDGLWVFGNFRTREEVLLRHSRLSENDPVSLTAFLDFQKHVRDISCLERAAFKTLGVQEKRGEVYFVTSVTEEKPYFVEAAAGYDTARDGYLSLSAGDRNFMGKNRRLSVETELSGTGYDTEAALKGYDFAGRKIETRLSVYTTKAEEKNQTFGVRKAGIDLTFQKEWSENLTAGTGFGFESREEYPRGGRSADGDEAFSRRGVFVVYPFLTYNSVNSMVYPKKGIFADFSVDYNRDVLENLDNFISLEAEVTGYKKVHARIVLALHGVFGHIRPLGAVSGVPADRLFYLGGISDVRGFEENRFLVDESGDPVGGRTKIAGSLEARFDLGGNFELPFFVDAGMLGDTPQNGGADTVKWTVGTGIRYRTPVGPVGLLYGRRMNPEDHEDTGRIHFSIGYTF